MAHFAELDNNNKVVRVLVTDNSDPAGDEGYSWLINNLGGRWIQTSYNASFRGKFAGIGDFYDEINDIFIPQKSTEGNWILNEETSRWDIAE